MKEERDEIRERKDEQRSSVGRKGYSERSGALCTRYIDVLGKMQISFSRASYNPIYSYLPFAFNIQTGLLLHLRHFL
jgi:hypothetical protein